MNSTAKGTSFSAKGGLNCAGKFLPLDKPLVMGILNITPDSFFDGGKYSNLALCLQQTENMLQAGASIIDIGALSTRPGALEVHPEEEIKRLTTVLDQLVKNFPEALFSIDTYRAEVARITLESGAHIINDISGGSFDPAMFQTVAHYKAPYVLMHIQGTPQNMQQNPQYTNVVDEVYAFFQKQCQALEALDHREIVLDPGYGFGKTLQHNYQLMHHQARFLDLGYPLLAGISRKSMINKVLKTTPKEALNGTTALNTIALLHGAKILRVHDVKEALEAIKIYNMLPH